MKKYLFGVLALVLAIGFSAFTKPATVGQTYVFVGNPNSISDLTNSHLWFIEGTQPSEITVPCVTAGSDRTCKFVTLDGNDYRESGFNYLDDAYSITLDNMLVPSKVDDVAGGSTIKFSQQDTEFGD